MPASIHGLAGLKELLDHTATTVGELKEANKAGALIVLDDSRQRVETRTGTLRRSGRASGTKKAGVVRYGGARVPYAAPYHFGHFDRPQGGFMRPDPFLYDALDVRAQEVVDRYEEFVTRALARLF